MAPLDRSRVFSYSCSTVTVTNLHCLRDIGDY